MKIIVVLILFLFAVVPVVYGSEISATPKNELVGPNDWITIFVVIDGYAGSPVTWNATQPDGTMIAGTFPSLQASKVTHNIIRTAFDNQFGHWTIEYQYKDLKKSVDVKVEPLTVLVTMDKDTYGNDDVAIINFSTNYYEPNAAKAETMSMKILDDDGVSVNLVDNVKTKVSQPNMTNTFSIDALLQHNLSGNYYVSVKYYSVQVDVPFFASSVSTKTNIFLGSDKNLYDPGDPIEINIVVPDISTSSGILTITSPSGKLYTATVSPVLPLNRITFEEVSSLEIGTFTATFEYGQNIATKTFDVLAESLEKPTYPSETIPDDIVIPNWIRNNAKWWASNQIPDNDFVTGMEFMIKEKIIILPELPSSNSYVTQIPDWIKNNAKRWSDEEITDQEFAKSIAFLVTSGIIKI